MHTIGRREFVVLPEIGGIPVEAKVDTGAYRTCVHCESTEEIVHDGKKFLVVLFILSDGSSSSVRFSRYRQQLVRSSFGEVESRYCVFLLLRLGQKKIRCEVSLSDRSGMRYKVLLGRKTLRNRFVVDVRGKYLLSS